MLRRIVFETLSYSPPHCNRSSSCFHTWNRQILSSYHHNGHKFLAKYQFNARHLHNTQCYCTSNDDDRSKAKIDLPNSKEQSSGPSLKSQLKKAIVKVIPKKKRRVDVTQSYTERNYITPLRAMNEYLLKPSDLEVLRKAHRRSPYANSPELTVYLRRDVEAKSVEIWGSLEALQRELKKRQEIEQQHRESQELFHVKKVVREYTKSAKDKQDQTREEKLLKGSKRVVLSAIVINASNFAFKSVCWLYTGSHSMFAESIHSLADTLNQLILAFGIYKSVQVADQDHPYGYHNMRYVASLISGVGIFCFGTGLSIYHGISGILHPEPMESLYWAYFILGGSLISEGGTLLIAYNEIKRGSREANMSMTEYIFRSQDPSVNVVLLEDLAAVIGVIVAGTCMGLTSHFGNPIYDAFGSILVGGLLGTVASVIIYTNSVALVGRSISTRSIDQINKELEQDVMIRAIYDVKATDIGSKVVRYKAEVDFDGRELTRSYLDKQDLEVLLEEISEVKTIEEVETYMLKHGENIIDLLGAEVDRIEQTLKKRHPEIRHVDLEIL